MPSTRRRDALRTWAAHCAAALVATFGVTGGSFAQTKPAGQPAQAPGQQKKQRPQRKLLPLPVYPARHRGKRKITVDGSLHEWPARLPAIILSDIRQLSGTAFGAYRGETDLTAQGAGLWDEEKLYLFFRIRDDWGRPLNTQLRLPNRMLQPPADSITLFFDPKRDTRSAGPDRGRVDDREYWCGMTTSGGTLFVEWQRFRALAGLPESAKARMLWNRKQREFTIEMSIPWKSISKDFFQPKTGASMDMQIIVDDYDAPTDTLPQTRIGWTFGSSPILNPAIYGTLMLVGENWNGKTNPSTPAHPRSEHPKLPGEKFWFDLQKDLHVLAAKPGLEGIAGRRGDLLRALDERLALYPVLDTQEIFKLLNREMPRELAGYLRSGPPHYQDLVIRKLLKRLDKVRKPEHRELVALPGRGFFYRSEAGQVLISPSSLHTHKLLPIVDAVLIAASNDPMQRSDALAVRARKQKIPLFAHLSFHLPGSGALDTADLVKPGEEMSVGKKLRVRMLADKDERGRVPPTMGYQLSDPKGFVLVAPALSARPKHVVLPDGKTSIDVLVLDPDHELADELVKKLKPRITVLEGFLDMQRWLGEGYSRTHRLAEASKAIERFEKLGTRVYLLSPGQALRLD